VVVVARVVDVLDVFELVESSDGAIKPRKAASDDESRFGMASASSVSGSVDAAGSRPFVASSSGSDASAAVSRFTEDSTIGPPEEKVTTTRAMPEITATIPDRRFQVRHERIEGPPAGLRRPSQSPLVNATSSGSAGAS